MKFLNYIVFFFIFCSIINSKFDLKKFINNKIEYFKKNPKKSIFFLTTGLMQFENLMIKKCCVGLDECRIICKIGVLLKIPFMNNIFFLHDLFQEKNNEEYFIKNIKKIDIFLLNLPIIGNYYFLKKINILNKKKLIVKKH